MTKVTSGFNELVAQVLLENEWLPMDRINLSAFLRMLASQFEDVNAYVYADTCDDIIVEIALEGFQKNKILDTTGETIDALLRTNPEALLPLAKQILSICTDNGVKVQSESMLLPPNVRPYDGRTSEEYWKQNQEVAASYNLPNGMEVSPEALENSTVDDVVRMI